MLVLPDFTKQFVIETNASDKGIGVVLMQEGHPMAFLSKALEPRAQGLSTYETEGLVVDQWRPYLQHAEYFIRADQRSLVHLENLQLTTP